MASQDFESLFKLLIIGNSGVGKTCIMTRFVDGSFEKSLLNTIGVDFKTKVVTVGKRKIKLQLWDTAGHERFKTITAAFYRGALGVMVVYDITDQDTFDEVQQWMDNISQKCGGDEPYVLLVGNKCDLDHKREIPRDQGQLLADQYECTFMETSALNSVNISEAFMHITNGIIEKQTKHVKAASGRTPPAQTHQGKRARGMTLEKQAPSEHKPSKCCSS